MNMLRQEMIRLLRQHRRQLNDEIGDYPVPITACDAQFNHLLERRRAIGRELRRLNDLSDAEVIDESQFVEACEYLSEIEKRTLRRSAPRE